MAIAAHLRELNERYSNLQECADRAPDGTYLEAKRAVNAVEQATQAIMDALAEHDFKAKNGDAIRNFAAAIYGYLLDSNPSAYGLLTGEGFGEHVQGPAGERILAQTVRDRDALARIMAGG